MPPFTGNLILVKIDTTPEGAPTYTTLGYQRGATLTVESELADASTKDGNHWRSGVNTYKSWSVECDALLVEDDATLLEIEERFFTSDAPANNIRIAWATPSSSTKFTGTVNIKSLKYGAADGDVATLELSLQGNGELVKA